MGFVGFGVWGLWLLGFRVQGLGFRSRPLPRMQSARAQGFFRVSGLIELFSVPMGRGGLGTALNP